MMVSFNFLTDPIELLSEKTSVLCIENRRLFRNTVNALYDGSYDENGIVFSENFCPIKQKGNICFIPDIFNIEFPSVFMKKIYADLTDYANTYLLNDVTELNIKVMTFLEKLSQSYDFDFEFKEDTNISDLLKMQSFRPHIGNEGLLSGWLDFITVTQKYSPVKCFVFLNLHCFFEREELQIFYKELVYRNVNVLVIENLKSFPTAENEKVYIVDSDLCEIIEN